MNAVVGIRSVNFKINSQDYWGAWTLAKFKCNICGKDFIALPENEALKNSYHYCSEKCLKLKAFG